jgi:hypothetical protein
MRYISNSFVFRPQNAVLEAAKIRKVFLRRGKMENNFGLFGGTIAYGSGLWPMWGGVSVEGYLINY